MSHEIYELENGRKSISFIGDVPWHGLGQRIKPNSPLEEWRVAAGLDWELNPQPVFCRNEKGSFLEIKGKKALVRSDNHNVLSVVSENYKIVQPQDILEFYRDLIDKAGFQMNTAGSIQEGRKVWTLAEVGREARIMGQDLIQAYLLLATSCDGSLATTAQFTSIRVVCNNTLSFAMQKGESGQEKAIRVTHNTYFDPQAVKMNLGLANNSFDSFIEEADKMAQVPVSLETATKFFLNLYLSEKEKEKQKTEISTHKTTVKRLLEVYEGGVGQNLKSTQGTAWGLVNAVTRYYDHERNTRSNSSRLNQAWFGDGEAKKRKAFSQAQELVKAA